MARASVVVPTYNQAKYLPICLDSVWFQEWDDLEMVVVNDGSPDDTREVLAAYEKDLGCATASYACRYDEDKACVDRTVHPRFNCQGRSLKIIHHEKNKGLSEALNTGFAAATGDYVTFIASDDRLLPGMIPGLAQALEQTGADFAYADMHVIDDAGRIMRRFSLPDYSFEACFCDWYFCGVAKLYRRELHQRFGCYDPAYTVQDHELYLRFAMGGARFVHVPRVLAEVRSHEQGAARQVDNHSPAGMNRLFRESSDLVRKARTFAGR